MSEISSTSEIPGEGGVGDQQLTGIVKFYNSRKGWGFITPDDGSRDVFLHSSYVSVDAGIIKTNDRCRYAVSVSQRGPYARRFDLL